MLLVLQLYNIYVLGTPNRVRREGVGPGRGFASQTSSVTEVASDEMDIEIEPERVTT